MNAAPEPGARPIKPLVPEVRPGTRVGPGIPRSGQVVWLGRPASVQFVPAILFRVTRALDIPTYDGWTWLEGYELDSKGEAVLKRDVFVQIRGIRSVGDPMVRATRRR